MATMCGSNLVKVEKSLNLYNLRERDHIHITFIIVYCYVCMVSQSYMTVYVTPWTIACMAPLFMVFQARILEWVAISSSRGSSQPRDRTCISCIGRWILYY